MKKGQKMYRVAIPKEYFSPDAKTTEKFTSINEVVKVAATNRTEASNKAWAEHGDRRLAGIREDVRTVSVYVNAPEVPGSSGLMGRLASITVFERHEKIGHDHGVRTYSETVRERNELYSKMEKIGEWYIEPCTGKWLIEHTLNCLITHLFDTREDAEVFIKNCRITKSV